VRSTTCHLILELFFNCSGTFYSSRCLITNLVLESSHWPPRYESKILSPRVPPSRSTNPPIGYTFRTLSGANQSMTSTFASEADGIWKRDPHNPHNWFRYVKVYTPPGVIKRIGGGNSSCVGLLEDGTVLKYPLVKGEKSQNLEVEKTIYDALGCHDRIVRCLGLTNHGLKLEFASNGSVSYRLSQDPTLSSALRLKWCLQAAEAVAFLHSKGVIHCDLHINNLLLDAELNALLSDFQGKFENVDGYAMESARYFLPRDVTTPPNEITDIFALGTLIYTIMVGSEPYPDLSNAEVEERYRCHEFPDTRDIVCGKIILKCWNLEYSEAKEVFQDLNSLQQKALFSFENFA
jgi:serine/threonine protein kinase